MAKYLVQRSGEQPGTEIPPDEPCFVIRAQDALAPNTIREYLEMAAAVNSPPEFLSEIERHLDRILGWQTEHGRKLPD
jgi:hypothetical protein